VRIALSHYIQNNNNEHMHTQNALSRKTPEHHQVILSHNSESESHHRDEALYLHCCALHQKELCLCFLSYPLLRLLFVSQQKQNIHTAACITLHCIFLHYCVFPFCFLSTSNHKNITHVVACSLSFSMNNYTITITLLCIKYFSLGLLHASILLLHGQHKTFPSSCCAFALLCFYLHFSIDNN